MSLFSMRTLEAVERVVVIVAAFAALLPIYQWYSEADARRLDRISTFATAGQACYEWYASLLSNPEYDSVNKALKGMKWEDVNQESLERAFSSIKMEDFAQQSLNSALRPVCSEIISMLHSDEQISKALLSQLYDLSRSMSGNVEKNEFLKE